MAANWTIAQVLTQLDSGTKWAGSTITYAFPTTASGLYSQGEAAGFRPIPGAQQSLFTQAIRSWDDLIAPSFTQTTLTVSNIEFGYSTTGVEYAHAYRPQNGSAWFLTGSNVATATLGSYGYLTIMHEIGHALGFRHMGNYNGEGTWTPSSYQDSTVLSIMSYFGPRGSGSTPSTEIMNADWTAANLRTYRPQTPMLNDVMAIQTIYGASTTTRTDNTVYGFSSNITGASADIFDFTLNQFPVLTIFDSGGIDTLNLSGWNTPSVVSLEPGAFSSGNDMTNNIVIAYSTVIENATTGGGNDVINGNGFNNQLNGGGGNDWLSGGGGDDSWTGELVRILPSFQEISQITSSHSVQPLVPIQCQTPSME